MSDPKLTEAQRQALYDALHDDIDGDFLIGADGYAEDIAMQHAGAADVVRWAVNAVTPVVARMVAEALVHDLPVEWAGNVHPYDVADALRDALDASEPPPTADLRAAIEAAIAPWPPGPRKGDVYRALDGGES